MDHVAAIYTRVSAEDGVKTSTLRQERFCREWVGAQGWEIAGVFEDVALSAYRPGVLRASFERLILEIRAKRVSVVVVWRLDRLVRSPAEYERILAVCQTAGVLIRSVTEPVDSVDPMGVAVGRIFAVFAGWKAMPGPPDCGPGTSIRALAGAMPDAGVFGVSLDGTHIVDHEAVLVREAARRVLLGEPVRHIVEDWQTRGVTRRDGKPFRYEGIRRLLSNPGVCGDRALHGEVVAEACWPTVIDRLTAAQVRNMLCAGPRHTHQKPLRHLLAGMVTCGLCGGRMIVNGGSFRRYLCSHPHQCHGTSIAQERLEAWVSTQVLNRLKTAATPETASNGTSEMPTPPSARSTARATS